VNIVDGQGRTTRLSYERSAGVLLEAADDLGHSLRLTTADACGTGFADELRFGERLVAKYLFQGYDLAKVTDGDGRSLREYAYDPLYGGLLFAVLNESGTPIAEFSYDGAGRATGLVDAESSVSVAYGENGLRSVTEHLGATSSTSQRRLSQSGLVESISDQCACGPARTFTYSAGKLTCTTDATGHITYYERDGLGRVIQQAQYKGYACPLSPTTTLPADRARQEWREYGVLKPIAQGVTLDLDRVLSVSRKSTFSSGYAAESFDYDPTTKTIDPTGYTCIDAPLPSGAVVCRHIETGYVTLPNNSKATERHATFYSYDARGRLVRAVGPINLDRPSPADVTPIQERTYWPDTESFDRRGRLHEVKRFPSPTSAPLITSYDYDAFGASQVTVPSGGVTTIAHDSRGRPTVVTGPGSGRVETRYYDGLLPRLTIQRTGSTRRYTYGASGRLASVEALDRDPEVAGAAPAKAWSEHHDYDLAGNRVHSERRDAAGAVVWTQDREYDVQHRVLRESHPEVPSVARSWSYDGAGFLTATTDEEGRGTVFTPDALGRVAKVRRTGFDAQGLPVGLDVAAYTYQNYSDSLANVADGKAYHQGTYYYPNDFGRLESLSTYTLSQTNVTYAYDARGNVLQRKFGTVTIDYTFDGLDRLLTTTARNTSDSSTISYTYRYDESGFAGFLTSVVEPERTVRFTYDAAGRVATETFEESGVATPLVTRYDWDDDGDLTRITLPSGLAIGLVLDPASKRPTRVYDAASGGDYASGVAFYPSGPLRSLTFGNGLPLAQTLNRRYEPIAITTGPLQLGYTMSPAGDVQSISAGSSTSIFAYDFLDRLVQSPGWFAYGYDGAGNRTSETVESASATYTLNFDRIYEQKVPSGATTARKLIFGHDNRLSVASVAAYDPPYTSPKRAVCLRHDALDRLTSVGQVPPTYAGSSCASDAVFTQPIARFKYDFRGRRVARWLASTAQWVYFVNALGGEPLEELERPASTTAPWSPVRAYVWLEGRPVAQLEHPGTAPGLPWSYAIHADHLGLPRAVTNASQAVVWSSVVRPYGDLAETTTPDPISGRTVVTNLRLPGQYDERLLGTVGLQGPYYNWNRWYLPGVGRYLEADPIALAGGFNSEFGIEWYGYAGENPLRYSDRRGLSYFDDRGCPGCEDTCCCAAVKYGPDACPGASPPRIPVEPGKPPPTPKRPTCETIEQQPPPPKPPIPNLGEDKYKLCVRACQAAASNAVLRAACYAMCLGVLAENL
jgi:RHS repeat-associated protein